MSEDARPDDGQLELGGVVTAEGPVEWGRMIARTAVGSARKTVKGFTVEVEAEARGVTVCVPASGASWPSDVSG